MLVLETDEPHPETQDRRGSFGEIFASLFKEAGNAHNPPLGVSTKMCYVVDDPENNHHGKVPHIAEIDPSISAILITGSMYDAHGDDLWIRKLLELLASLWRERKEIRFCGVCFGHQILARMLGAKVQPTKGGKWELAHTEMDLSKTGQQLFRTKQSTLSLHQMHQDQVTTTPSSETSNLLSVKEKVEVWASTKHTPIQGLYLRDRLFTSQGHLGFDEKMVHRQIEMREKSGGIEDKEDADEGRESAHMRHDGTVVAGAILRFFHGEDS